MKTVEQLIAEYNAAYDQYELVWDDHIAWKEPFYAGSYVPFLSWSDLHDTIEEQSPFRTALDRARTLYNTLHDQLIAHPEYNRKRVRWEIREDWQND